MTTWSEFQKKAKDPEWDIRQGEAFWNGNIKAKVQIAIPSNSLEPTRERIIKSKEVDIEFQVYFISKEPVMYLDAQKFAVAWVDLWGRLEPLEIIDGPPPNFEPPASFDFTPELRDIFNNYRISLTSLAPIWGQPRHYFKDYDYELNAGPKQNNDPFIKYQQEWVEKNLWCPFCLHIDWTLTYANNLKKPAQQWYDPHNLFYVLTCPKCERAVECIPKEMIK